MSRITWKPAWDFDDYKGWEAFIGKRSEGMLTWRAKDNDMVLSGELEAGFGFHGHHDNQLSGDGYKTLEEAKQAFEEQLFGVDA